MSYIVTFFRVFENKDLMDKLKKKTNSLLKDLRIMTQHLKQVKGYQKKPKYYKKYLCRIYVANT